MEATPTHTGLPPHITILENFEQLMIKMESTKNAILSGVEAELDRRRIGSQSHFDKEEILSWIASMHTELLKKVDMCLRSLTTALQGPCFDAPGNVNEIFVNEEEESARKLLTIVLPNSSKKFHFFYLKGQVKRFPNDFVFPHMSLCALVVNWFCGNPTQKTLPLRFFVPANLKSRLMKSEHRKMKILMGTVITGAQHMEVWDGGQNGAWDVPWAMQLYNCVQPLFKYPSLTSTHRNEQISWRTVYNLYIKSRQITNGCGRRRHQGNGGAGIGDVEDWMDAVEELT